jgi:flagellar secretion chaperone FliS
VTPQALNAQHAYRKVQTDSASREETVVLLFEGIVRFLHQARAAMDRGDLEEQSRLINRVQRILSELTLAVSDEPDPTLAVSLRCSYTSMYNRLMEANISDDLNALDDVIQLASRFAEAWRMALQKVTSPVASEAAPAQIAGLPVALPAAA